MKFPLKYKAALLILAIVLATSVVATVVSSTITKDIEEKHYIEKAVNLADTVAVSVDAEAVRQVREAVLAIYEPAEPKVLSDSWGTPEFDAYLARFASVEAMPAYQDVLAQLRQICVVNDVPSVYLLTVDAARQTIIYLADGSEELFCPPGVADPFYGDDANILTNPDAGFAPTVTDTEEYGWLVATGRPVYAPDGELIAYAGVDVSMEAIAVSQQNFIRNIALALLVLAVVASVIGIFLVDRFLVRPINILSNAAQRYTGEDEGVQLHSFSELSIHTRDEVEALADSMARMEEDINRHIANLLSTTQALVSTQAQAEKMDRLASIDALTKVRNKRGYDQESQRLDQLIQQGNARFCLLMIDLNDLKQINDTYGHDKGDIAITTLCRLVCRTFQHSPVFRVGGDEFVVLLENEDYDHREELIAQFNAEVDRLRQDASLEPWQRISAALGCARFDPAADHSADSVLRRADAAMYRRKKQMKG